MSQLTGNRILNALYGLLSGLDATDRALLSRVVGGKFKTRVALGDRGATATSAPATPFFTNDEGVSLRVTAAKLLTPTTIAPGATHNVAFVLDKVDSAGANGATVASYTSDVAGGTATADVPKALTVVGGTSTVAVLASGWTLRASATKGGSGVIISDGEAPCILEVTMEYDV
jgi:hypothetical protein